MIKVTDSTQREYIKACLKFADSCHVMSEAHEKGAFLGFKNTLLGGLELALKWEKLCLKERKRYRGVPEKINSARGNIMRLKIRIRKYEKILSRDNEFKNI